VPIDDGLIGGIHVARLARAEATLDVPHDHVAFQASTLNALMSGSLRGDLSVAELLDHGDLGLGTVDRLDGELIIVDGVAWVARADGTVEAIPGTTRTPFAVVCAFHPERVVPLAPATDFAAVTEQVDALFPRDTACLAVRLEADVAHARLRSVPAQTGSSPTLADAVASQTMFDAGPVRATVVGFRFPRDTEGLELPGWHLHLIAADRSIGGHVLDLAVTGGTIAAEREHELHVEVPVGVAVGPVGHDARRAKELDRLER
jgi:acetolactate decarboxylase